MISGAKELEKALKQLPKSTSKSVLRTALRNAAKPTVNMAKATAPVGPTGNLRSSITAKTSLSKSQKKRRQKVGDVEMFIGPTAPHGHLLEFGTVKMAPRPFMRPAWDSTKQEVLDSIEKELWQAISKAASRLAKKAEAGTFSRTARRALGG